MKITKIKTCAGRLGTPVTTELEAVVERMRSLKTKEAADRIAAIALVCLAHVVKAGGVESAAGGSGFAAYAVQFLCAVSFVVVNLFMTSHHSFART